MNPKSDRTSKKLFTKGKSTIKEQEQNSKGQYKKCVLEAKKINIFQFLVSIFEGFL